ncbi:MAG: hypothetical protein HY057_04025 [Rhodospirillales bacterium]|nr:hypothetical protein [Rhodospirillales bacterium]
MRAFADLRHDSFRLIAILMLAGALAACGKGDGPRLDYDWTMPNSQGGAAGY